MQEVEGKDNEMALQEMEGKWTGAMEGKGKVR